MIQFKRPETKTDFKQLSVTIGKAIIDGVAANPTGIASNAIDAIASAFGEPEQTAESQAWRWMNSVLAQATSDFLTEPRLRSLLLAGEVPKVVDQVLETLPESGQVAPRHLINPATNVHFHDAIGLIPGIAERVAPENGQDDETLKILFRQTLSDATGKVFASDSTAFSLLSAALQSQMASAEMREVAWRRHANWIRQRFTRDPIFSPDSGEKIPLKDVYLRGRCYWHSEVELPKDQDAGDRRESSEPKTFHCAHLRDLHDTMHAWLDKESRNTPIRVVAGGPGCGKSSFARAFATEVIDQGHHRVLFVPLQYLRRSGNLDDDIGRYLIRQHQWVEPDSCQGFPENPLDWRGDDTLPILLVFDGLDEMSAEERTARDISRQFLFALKNMLTPLNTGPAPEIRAMVLGRSTACQDALKEASMGIETMLNVAKITPLNRSDLELPDHEDDDRPDLDDADDLINRDDRGLYWRQWSQVKRVKADDIPEAVTSEKVRDLNAEPLLLHLLIISDYVGENWQDNGEKWQEAAENPNLVYQDILSKIHQRNQEKEGDSPAKRLDKEDFFTLMECLGLAAWRGNGRTGTDAEFRELREKHASHKRKKFEELDAAELDNVAIQLHTRQAVGDDKGFEFIHKSFGEYLAARALISAARRRSARLENDEVGIGPGEAAMEWAEIIGNAELTPFILTFLKNEAKLTFKTVDPIPVKTDLETVLGWIQQHGIPVHRANTNASFRTLERLQRRAESAMIVTATAITSAAQTDESPIYLRVPWPQSLDDAAEAERQANPRGALRMFHRLGVTNSAVMAQALEYLDLGNQMLSSTDLSRAHLSGAHLSGANLSGADLFGANLSGADLFKANLSGADLFGAHLSGANLSGANLSGANLFKADLSRANLSEANLSRANFRSVHIESCDLKFVDLTETLELTQDQVNSAKGSKKTTRLPKGLELPDHWDED